MIGTGLSATPTADGRRSPITSTHAVGNAGARSYRRSLAPGAATWGRCGPLGAGRACRCSLVRRLRAEWLRGDLIAGLTVWAVLVPEALAYASIAGVSPVVGLYAAPPALILYAVFGSSRHLVVGPMSATAALSAAAVADLTTGGPDEVAAFTACPRPHDRRAGARRRPAAPGLPRQLHLRAGAEGLHHRPRPDDHHRPGAQAVRHREDRRRLLRAAVGCRLPPGRDAGSHARRRAGLAGRRARCCAASRRWCPARSSLSSSASSLVQLFDLDNKGVDDRRPDRQRPARRSASPTASASPTTSRGRLRGGDHARGVRRRPRRRQDLRRPRPLRDRRQPRAARPRRRQPRLRSVERDGRQRQPVEDRGQRLGRGALAALRARRRRR